MALKFSSRKKVYVACVKNSPTPIIRGTDLKQPLLRAKLRSSRFNSITSSAIVSKLLETVNEEPVL
jgi:hypothetical protein